MILTPTSTTPKPTPPSSVDPKVNPNSVNSNLRTNQCAPFPTRLVKPTKNNLEKEIWEVFRKVQVNIPLLDAISQVPRYAKFLKDLCTNKRKLKGNEIVTMTENVSAVLQHKLPPKCKDMGSFSVPITIGSKRVEKAMCDLGASINVML